MDALQQVLVPLCNIPAAEQILIQSGKPLDARKQLSAYGLPVGTFIAVHLPACGACKQFLSCHKQLLCKAVTHLLIGYKAGPAC